jgi:hypothetical protein
MNPFEKCPCSDADAIEITMKGLFDGVLLYRCTICKRFRHRWRIGSAQRYIADGWLSENNLIAYEMREVGQ